MTELIINTNDYNYDIVNYIGTLFKELYPDIMLFLNEIKDSTYYYYKSNIEFNTEEFLNYVENNHCRCREKQEEISKTTECKVIKYENRYYILDGDTKIPLNLP